MILFRRWLITALCLVFVIAGLGFIKYKQVQAAIAFGESFPEASETVRVTEVNWTQWQPHVELVAEVKAPKVVELRNELEGIITSVGFDSGAKVEQGQVLIQFNIDEELASLDAIKAEIALSELDVKRFADLVNVKASSKEQLDRAKAQLLVNNARAKALQATIAKKTLLAPFSGRTNIHDWQVGSFVSANTLMTRITGDTTKLFVDFNVPQVYADFDLEQGVHVIANKHTTKEIPAKIVALNQQFNTSSRSIQARAEFTNPDNKLTPGSVVKVRLPTGPEIPVVALPSSAIRFDAFGSYVNVLLKDDKGDYRSARRPIVIAHKQENYTYVSSGIDSGDLVATVGSAKLRPNLLTKIAK